MNARGGASWSAVYSKQYGKDRWKTLLKALADVPNQIAFVSPTISLSALRYLLRKLRFSPCLIPNCFTTGSIAIEDSACAGSNAGGEEVAVSRGLQTHLQAQNGAEVPVGPVNAPADKCQAKNAPFTPERCIDVASVAQQADSHVQVIDDDHVVEEANEMTYFLGNFSLIPARCMVTRLIFRKSRSI